MSRLLLKRRSRVGWLVLALLVASWSEGGAADRANVPLKNWGGFAVYRDAVYDDLERLVTAGLADRAVLNTKPLSRTEAARIVARAIENIRIDVSGRYNTRGDLEPVLDRLIAEFRSELAALGVKGPTDLGPAPGFVSFVPVDRVQVRGGWVSRELSLANRQGFRLQDGFNGATTLESRAQIGDFLTFYLQPELHGNEEFGAARLATGYAKLTLFNVELLVGRDSLWWGPGLHGSLIMSSNAPPLDQIRVGAAEPFLLPWVGEWVGPTKILAFLAELETRRDHRRPKLFGLRGTIAPASFLELGASYTNMFDGQDRPRLSVADYPRVIFDPQASDQKNPANERFRNNAVFALDAELRIRNVDRYFIPARDLRLYGEFGWDDTCCSTAFVPLRDAISGLVGVQLLGAMGMDGVDARFEYATTSRLSFTHNQFYRGYWTRGEVLSHFIGTEGSDLFSRVTSRVNPDVMVGFELNRAEIGDTTFGALNSKERRLGAGLDVSYRFARLYSVFAQYQLTRVSNRNFHSGDDGFDHLLWLELTRSFR